MSRRYPGFTKIEHMIAAGELEEIQRRLEDFEGATEKAYSSQSWAHRNAEAARGFIERLRKSLCEKAVTELLLDAPDDIRAMYYPVQPPPKKD